MFLTLHICLAYQLSCYRWVLKEHPNLKHNLRLGLNLTSSTNPCLHWQNLSLDILNFLGIPLRKVFKVMDLVFKPKVIFILVIFIIFINFSLFSLSILKVFLHCFQILLKFFELLSMISYSWVCLSLFFRNVFDLIVNDREPIFDAAYLYIDIPKFLMGEIFVFIHFFLESF